MSDPNEEVYEVESIVGHKIVRNKKKHEIMYLIKWLGYTDEDNTWEKEANVFATDMIVSYWLTFPKDDPERMKFLKIQSSKSEPILLPGSPEPSKQEISPEPSSSQVTETKKQTTLDSSFKSSPLPEKRLPLVIANQDDDDEDEPSIDEPIRKDTDDEFNLPLAESSSSSSIHPTGDSDSSDVEIVKVMKRTRKESKKKQSVKKAKTAAYSDYFLEEHLKKKKREEDGNDSSSETSSVHSVEPQTNHDTEGPIIFDEYFANDPPMDWDSLAEKVEYIGRELPESPLYCIVKWKDGVRSMHPLSLVRVKRPDLIIDRFVTMIDN